MNGLVVLGDDMTWLNRISPCVRVVGTEVYEAGWVEPLRVIYEHELVLFEDGDFMMEIEGVKHPCPNGSFIVVPPGVWHMSRMISGYGGRRRWIHFDWTHQPSTEDLPLMTFWPSPPITKLFRFQPDWIPKPLMQGDRFMRAPVNDLHDRLYERWNNGTRHERTLCRGLLLELLIELFESDEAQPRDSGINSSRIASMARRVLGKLACEGDDPTRSVQSAFKSLGYSYAHVCRIFRRAYGITPVGYMNSLRLERARTLILDTQLNISEIASRVGYTSPAYFGRLFRKNSGRSPREYRQECGSGS